jgi:GNAT superfamily N-acetyltransferase
MVQLEKLAWDSEHFGVEVGRIVLEDGDDARLVRSVLDKSEIDVAIARTRIEDIRGTNVLEDVGFRVKDVRLRLDLNLGAFDRPQRVDGPEVRPYRSGDRDLLRRISRDSFWSTHFHTDHRFNREKVDEMYDNWLDKAIKENYFIYVALHGSKIEGFIASREADGEYHVELVAVEGKSRGMGVGECLTVHALQIAKKDFSNASIGVQLQNIAAVRLYEKVGFRISSGDSTLHWWRGGGNS